MRIWKYTLNLTGLQTVELPRGARPLTVQMQGIHPQLWAMCDPEQVKEKRTIAMYATGNPLPDEAGAYIATFQSHGGALAFHVFDHGVATDRAGSHV